MHVALATCRKLPDWERDDEALHAAFAERGVELAHVFWDDPEFDWAGVDACLLRTTWDYQERLPEFLAWVDEVQHRTRLFNPAATVRWNAHKSYLRDLERRGARILPTLWLRRGEPARLEALIDELEAQLDGEFDAARLFLKPAVGATARETLRFDREREGLERARAHLERLLPREDLLLQPYLASVETRGEFSSIWIDGEATHTVRKTPQPGDYRTQDDWGGRDAPHAPSQAEDAFCAEVLRALEDEPLYARVDYLLDGKGDPLLLELELVEPALFFRHAPRAAPALADALLRRLA